MALKIKIKVFNSSMKTCTDGQMSPFTQSIDTLQFGCFFCGFVLFDLFLSAVALLNNLGEDFKLGRNLQTATMKTCMSDSSNELSQLNE